MTKVESFSNELMSSNCYVIYDDVTKKCIVIDPGSQYSKREIDFINKFGYTLDYVLLTHEHTDHTWGCNAIIEHYPTAKIACSEACAKELPKAGDMYFRLYYDDPNYHYNVKKIDFVFESVDNCIQWNDITIVIFNTPGHSLGSVCILIDDALFTGDTIMQYKPYIPSRKGSIEQLNRSIEMIVNRLSNTYMVFPGHGPSFLLKDYCSKVNV